MERKMRRLSIYFLIVGLILLGASVATPKAEAFALEEKMATYKALAHYAMGQVCDLLGDVEQATLEYETAARFDNAAYLTHLRLGVNYARLNMLTESEGQLFQVQQYNPQDLQSHYLLALVYSAQKNYEKAADEYEFILKKFADADPNNVEVYGYLGQLYYSQKKYEQAIAQFEKIFALEPNNADVMYLLGSLYLEVKQSERAISLLQKSITIDPEHDGSLNTLGYVYAENNVNLDEAQSLIERALKINPKNGAYLDSLGWVYYKKGKYGEALNTLKEADQYMKDPVIYDHLGDAYYKLNLFDDALKSWELSLSLLPGQDSVVGKINALKNLQANKQALRD